MIKPKALQPGMTIGVVSPASPLSPAQTEKGLNLLREVGFKLKLFPHVYDADGFLAGTDENRAADLTAAFLDPEVDAVYCSRGGYGCSRLIPLLDFDLLVRHPKFLIGFSDITVLHAAFNRRGVPTLHAPMALTLHTDRQPWVYESFLSSLQGKNPIASTAPKGKCLVGGVAEGTLIGGCLILMCDLIGTKEQIDMRGKIVLIEDVDEMPHRVDAMLTHLLNSNSIQSAAGIVVGEMTRTDDRPDEMIGAKPWREIVRERLAPLGVPTIVDFPCGHAPQMLSLPLGIRVRINAGEGSLEYLESICE